MKVYDKRPARSGVANSPTPMPVRETGSTLPPAEPATDFDVLVSRLRSLHGRLSNSADRIGNVLNNLDGSNPMPPSEATAGDDGTALSVAHSIINEISTVSDRLSLQADRIAHIA